LKDYVRVSIGLFAPRFDETFEVNIAEQLTATAIAKSFNVSVDQVKALVRQRGDFGDVAVELRGKDHGSNSTSLLTLKSIVQSMKAINALEGHDSQAQKVDMLCAMFRECSSDDELRYLVRSFANTGLRIGLSSKSVEKCILDFFEGESGRKDVDQSLIQTRIEDFERSIFGYRIQKLHNDAKTAIYDVPVKSMLGRAARDAEDVIKVLGKKVNHKRLSADFKYDGERT
jgi:ATP-dependent DNA ligase